MSSAHSPTFPSLHLRHNSFSNPSVALPTSQLILQSFRCFNYVTVHSPTLLSLLLLILQSFRHFIYVTTHSPTLPSLYLRHSSFSNPSVASPTSQYILQPFFRFSYVTGSSLTSPGEPPKATNNMNMFIQGVQTPQEANEHCSCIPVASHVHVMHRIRRTSRGLQYIRGSLGKLNICPYVVSATETNIVINLWCSHLFSFFLSGD